jgi:uncharacterized protein with HEPN domain
MKWRKYMPHKNDVPYLLHIRDAVNDIKKFIDGMDFLSFSQNDLVASAVIRKLEIIGEASNKISGETKEEYSEIPWRTMTDMRNVLIHHYFGVDLTAVWDTIQKDLPSLKEKIEKIIKMLKEAGAEE